MPRDRGPAAFLLLGPTAVGKSDIAVALAERVGGEIVSADAFQIYAGLDILSAKPSAELRARVPHHLVGEAALTATFDVAQWLARARQRIAEIAARGRLPIVTGGTGLYVRALAHGLAELPSADPALRAALEREPLPALAARLRALDPTTTVDTNNPRRVIRALEVCILTGRPFSDFRAEWKGTSASHGVILTRPREDLSARIDARTKAMFAAGVVGEVAATGSIGTTAAQMLGLREIRALLAESITLPECIAAIEQATRRYSRRQLTWLRKERGCRWLDLSLEPDVIGVMERAVGDFRRARPSA
jgi:tRNA dimethylallyltransferase